ncbi:glycerophosphoryl diester phosphodiesterase [Kibdelosporangium banguiense]|uniref:glycerophosphodiester phosphodiesterase n=1 Tax=Kibdelosporangium banguiense TaxID=1365924 RepID=A0ABS4TDW7_9PSEU|nr:glycerophosphodiester phosphodiesterase [Kibdelosporangium banguiense]MBP2322058.1 glycerophosphoryl diester phosphodiesterase [Kibdelosporangium banguiense]
MGRRLAALALSGVALVSMVGVTAAADQDSRGHTQAGPLIFGHRGASGYRPEHTLASYELAARMGADYIEPDLVSTKDGVLVARHENEISGTTNVASKPEFAGRKTTKTIDGIPLTGWFTEDFTLAELKTLRAIERIPDIRQRNTIYNGRFEVPTFQEVIDLSKRLSRELGRDIGIAPETKHPTYFQTIGKPLEPALIRTLDRNDLNNPSAKVVVQSFEVGNLVALNRSLRVQLVQLTSATGAPYDFIAKGDPRTYADIITPAGLRDVARYADWLGPEKGQIIPRNAAGFLQAPTTLVSDAHRAGLKVVPYTFRNENAFLPADFRSSTVPAEYGNAFGEFEKFFATGIDGLFTDNTDTAIEARRTKR